MRPAHRLLVWISAMVLFGGSVVARADADATEAPPSKSVRLPADTPVTLHLLEAVGSDSHARGAHFKMVVFEAVVADEVVVIPAGTPADGQVIHANKSGIFGKPGELTITSRSVSLGDRTIKLHSLLTRIGQSRTNLASGLLLVPLAPIFVHGNQIVVPADTEVVAKTLTEEVFETTQPNKNP
jgi:hypothetical protein